MKKLLYILPAGFFFLVSIILVILLLVQLTNTNKLNADNQALVQQLQNAQQSDQTPTGESDNPPVPPVQNEDSELTFKDDGMEIEFQYPESWEVIVTTEAVGNGENTDLYSYPESVYGPILITYEIEISTPGALIHVTKILGGVGDTPEGYDETTQDLVELGESGIARVGLSGETSWAYSPLTTCDPDFTPGAETCFTHFYPGFGLQHFATQVAVTTSSAELLAEADAIVLSALN